MPRLRVAISGTGTHENWGINNDYALTAAVPSLAVLQAIATALATALAASVPFKGGFCSDFSVTEVKLLHYPSITGEANLVATGALTAFPGSAVPAMPPQVCVVASLRTNNAGRSFRGRTYWPYRSGGILANGTVSSAGQSAVTNASQALKAAVVTACTGQSIGAAWGVFSPKLGVITPIVDVLVGSQCDTMRRRNINRAETYAVSPVTATEITVPDQAAKDQVDAVIAQFLNSPISLSEGIAAATTLAQVVSVIAEDAPESQNSSD